jgi:hypothetical protein
MVDVFRFERKIQKVQEGVEDFQPLQKVGNSNTKRQTINNKPQTTNNKQQTFVTPQNKPFLPFVKYW